MDGQVVATQKLPRTVPILIPVDETFDVRLDTRTSVNEKDYQVPFAFTCTINKLTYHLGQTQLSAEEQSKAEKAAIAKH